MDSLKTIAAFDNHLVDDTMCRISTRNGCDRQHDQNQLEYIILQADHSAFQWRPIAKYYQGQSLLHEGHWLDGLQTCMEAFMSSTEASFRTTEICHALGLPS